MYGFECGYEFTGREGLGEVPVDAARERRGDEGGMEVPGVDDDAPGAWVGHERVDVAVIGVWLGERVVQDDVDDVVVVVGQSKGDRTCSLASSQ